MSCVTCGCKQHVANRFQPEKCATCLHPHSRAVASSVTPTASSNPVTPPKTPPPPPTRKTPSPRPSPAGSPMAKRREPSPNPKSVGKQEGGVWEKMKGDFMEMKEQVVDKASSLTRSNSTGEPISAPKAEEKKPDPTKPSMLTKSISVMKDMKDKALGGEQDVAISGPRGFKHHGHMGMGKDGGFEVRNMPPEMNQVLRGLDGELKRMGAKGVTKKEARMLYKAARTSVMHKAPAGEAPPSSPGRESMSGKPLPPPPKKDLPLVPPQATRSASPRPASPRPGNTPPSRPAPSATSTDADQRRIRALEEAKHAAERQANNSSSEVARLKKELAEEKRMRQEAEDTAGRVQEQLEELRLRAATAPGSAASKGLEMQLQELRKKTAQETEVLRQRSEEEAKKRRAVEDRCKELERAQAGANARPSAEDQAALRKRHDDEMTALRNRLTQEVDEASKRWEAEIKARLALQEQLRRSEEEVLKAKAGGDQGAQNVAKEMETVRAKFSADTDALRKKAEEDRVAAEGERKNRRAAEQERDDLKRKLVDAEASSKDAKGVRESAVAEVRAAQAEAEANARKLDEERAARSKEEGNRRALELELAEVKAKAASKSGDEERKFLEAEVSALKAKLGSAHDGHRRKEEEESSKRKAAEEELRGAQVEISDIKARLAAADEARRSLETEVTDLRAQAREAAVTPPAAAPSPPPPPPSKAPPPPPKAPKAPLASSPASSTRNLAPTPAAPAGQSALLAAISNPDNNKMLKHVSIQMKDSKAADDNSMLNILARALIERRTNMKEGEGEDEEDAAEEGDDEELDWED